LYQKWASNPLRGKKGCGGRALRRGAKGKYRKTWDGFQGGGGGCGRQEGERKETFQVKVVSLGQRSRTYGRVKARLLKEGASNVPLDNNTGKNIEKIVTSKRESQLEIFVAWAEVTKE